ncbi:MAG: ABC transporter substrate-binding protein [Bacteroidia bacterium]|jgi:branched-chain amino acid transport system substrate-binding protein|nr:ABC transporter substrate-binding protein [Bacteroidia bacterium]
MQRIKKIFIFMLLLSFMITGSVWAKGEDINIAALVSLTGSGAFYGKAMRDIAKGIVEEINKQGIKGFGKMNITFYDDATDAAVAASQIQRAVTQGSHFIWGGFASAVETMMVKKGEELKIPVYLTNEHTYDAIPCNTKYTLTPVVGTVEIAKVCADYFKKKNVKTYAIIGADYIYGRSWDKALTLFLKGTGIKKVYENWHDFSKVDYSADIAKLKQLKPDAVVRSFGGAGEYVIIKQMKNSGYWPSIFIANCTISGYQVPLDELGERYMVGVTAETCQDPSNPKWIEFARTHKEKYGYWPTWLSQGVHDTLWHIKKVVETAQSLNPEKLAKTMHEVSYDGVGGFPFGPFQDSGYVKNATIYLVEYKKGSPSWTNKIGVHREVVDKLDLRPMCKEEIEALLKQAQ